MGKRWRNFLFPQGVFETVILCLMLLWVFIAFVVLYKYLQKPISHPSPINLTYNIYIKKTKPVTIYETKCTITGYNPTTNQCDSTPNITASNKIVRLGMVAVSRDLEKKYDLKFGDYVFIEDLGLFEFQDRLNKKIKNTIDVLCWNRKTAYKLTKKQSIVHFIKVHR